MCPDVHADVWPRPDQWRCHCLFVAIAHIRGQQIRNIQLRGYTVLMAAHMHKLKLWLKAVPGSQLFLKHVNQVWKLSKYRVLPKEWCCSGERFNLKAIPWDFNWIVFSSQTIWKHTTKSNHSSIGSVSWTYCRILCSFVSVKCDTFLPES